MSSITHALGNRNILIVGAGIAGPVLAHFLHRFGMKSVVVERTPQLRTVGQTVDLRFAAIEVARRMGLEEKIRERCTKECGVAFVDKLGRTQVAFHVDTFGGQGFVSEIEILRGELANILYEHTSHHTEYIFDDYPVSMNENNDHVQVVLNSGNTRNFDLVIGADGMHSTTRRLIFGDDSFIHYLGMYIAYFTIPYEDSDSNWARFYRTSGGRSILIRPDNQGTTRAYLAFYSKERGYEKLDKNKQKELLHKVFENVGFEASRVLNGLNNADDFYFEDIGQIKMNQWSKGRVALIGDAAHCASPLSGMGTSLAFIGPYFLAGELSRHRDHTEAFKQYELLTRPYVKEAFKLPSINMRFGYPKTSFGIGLSTAMQKFVVRPSVARIITKLMANRTAQGVSLPQYESRIA